MRHSSVYGTFCIDAMPGQPQVGLCHGFFVPVKNRGKGFANKLKHQQAQALKADNFDFGLCTVDAPNAVQQHVLEKAGWSCLAEFSNSRTGGRTQVWGVGVES